METTPTPETDTHMLGGSYSFDVDFARKLERERDEARQAITDLAQRLQERQESFQAQLIRIEDTWREKLRVANSVLKLIANQKISKEHSQHELESADFEFGYDYCVEVAREAIKP